VFLLGRPVGAGRIFFYETINSSKKDVSLIRKLVIKGGGTSVLLLGSMCSLRDHK